MANVVGVLSRLDLLDGVDVAALETLGRVGRPISCGPGEFVVRQGEFGDSFFVLLSGTVRVQVAGDDGRMRDVAELKGGQYFGELAMLGFGERLASVRAGATARRSSKVESSYTTRPPTSCSSSTRKPDGSL